MDKPIPSSTHREKILYGLAQVRQNLIAYKKAKGTNLIVWRDGKIVEITPEEAERESARPILRTPAVG